MDSFGFTIDNMHPKWHYLVQYEIKFLKPTALGTATYVGIYVYILMMYNSTVYLFDFAAL